MSRYDRSSGRARYDLEEGVLGHAFNRGEAEQTDLPDAGTAEEPRPGWKQRQARTGLTDDHILALTMRSRSYAALRLNAGDKPLGVLIIESEKPDGASLASVKSATIRSQVVLSRLLGHVGGTNPERLLRALTPSN